MYFAIRGRVVGSTLQHAFNKVRHGPDIMSWLVEAGGLPCDSGRRRRISFASDTDACGIVAVSIWCFNFKPHMDNVNPVTDLEKETSPGPNITRKGVRSILFIDEFRRKVS